MLALTALWLISFLNVAAQKTVPGVDPAASAAVSWINANTLTDTSGHSIVLQSTSGNILTFSVARNSIILDGIVNLNNGVISACNLSALVPVWGRTPLVTNVSGSPSGLTVDFQAGNYANGELNLAIGTKFFIQYIMNTTWAGQINGFDSTLFIPPPQSPPPTIPTTFKPENDELLEKFFTDHLNNSTGIVLVESFTSPGGKSPASVEYTFTVGFLEFFEFEGSIDLAGVEISADLYVVLPIWGRVLITAVTGQVPASIKISGGPGTIATGTLSVTLENGKEVWIDLIMTVQFLGSFSTKEKLFTLP